MEALTDDAALAKLSRHHTEMVATLDRSLDALASAWGAEDGAAADREATALYTFLREDVLPHAEGEEHTLYAAARAANALLVGSLLDEHVELRTRIDACGALLGAPGDGDRRAGRLRFLSLAHEIAALFQAHAHKEDRYLIPLVRDTARPGALAELFVAMHAPRAST